MPDPEKKPGGETPPGDEKPVTEQGKEAPKGGEAETVESLKAHVAKLNEESKKHRLEAKTAKEALEKANNLEAALKKALGLGEQDPVEAKIKDTQAKGDERVKRTLLKSAVVAEVAKDAHNADAVWKLLSNDLKDVSVDLENETVDTKTLKDRISSFRKDNPFLFQAAGGGDPTIKPKGNMPTNGQPSGGGGAAAQWKQLKESGDAKAANDFYLKNRDAIIRETLK